MANEVGEWKEYSRLILAELERLSNHQIAMSTKLTELEKWHATENAKAKMTSVIISTIISMAGLILSFYLGLKK